MDDIRRQDLRLFLKELRTPGRILLVIVGVFFVYVTKDDSSHTVPVTMAFFAALLWAIATAYSNSVRKRFRNKQMESLWTGCQDRLARFEEVLRRMRREPLTELHEMPKTIRAVAKSLYAALRRADFIAEEVAATESGMLARPPVWQASTSDAQSRELYRIADKNIAEYTKHFAGVMAGVQRTEAQSAVFMTTLDTLRMKLIGYRLVGRSPELQSQEFLETIAEARAQLNAIDTALEELDLSHFPKTYSAIPPMPPDEVLRIRNQS
ncbi:MAG TPA: hypothetical protein VG944_08755 [Fimbriimonas sp.]|nr:hypothetical protein [Fimbriimonas sp.]